MEQTLPAHVLPKENIVAIIILYKNTEVKVRSLDGDTDYFDIVAGVLQGDTLFPYLFIICLHYVLRTSVDLMKENGFTLGKERNRRYPAQTDADYADDTQAENLLRSQERVAAGIGLDLNAHKRKYICFNQRCDICTINGSSLKIVDKFTYQGRSGINKNRLAKAWTLIDRLSVIWKSNMSDKLKRSFFSRLQSCQYCYMDAPRGRWYAYGDKAWRQLLKNAAICIERVLEATTHKATDVRPPTTHHENYSN